MAALEVEFFVQYFIRFFDYVRITGGFRVGDRAVKSLKVIQFETILATGQVNLPCPGHSAHCGFQVDFTAGEFDPEQLRLMFELEDGQVYAVTGKEAADFYLRAEGQANVAEHGFFGRLKTAGYDRVLEVGSRARSGVTRRRLFEGKQYTGLDILNGENVDVLGDAHALSSYFAPESFDAVFSASTFEHLAMPWKVAIELNKILRVGGIAYLVTHQALGMHDLPWDFWRFSDTSWNSLFNEYSGFRVVDTFLGGPMQLVPFIYWDHWKGFEGSAGFSTSAVLIEKTGPTALSWDLDVAKVTQGLYPA